ncbi:MAG: hypothetical protein LUE24_05240 [Lachnospiraceae bacterium]|nr:hypothetical protein [Lachnospiraceae bacterium]
MRARNRGDAFTNKNLELNALLIDTQTLQNVTASGRKTALEIGEAAGARVKIGRRVLWNVSKIRIYLDSVSEN